MEWCSAVAGLDVSVWIVEVEAVTDRSVPLARRRVQEVLRVVERSEAECTMTMTMKMVWTRWR